MRIVFLIHSLDPVLGGPSEVLPHLAHATAAMGHEVTVVTLDPPGSPYLTRPDVRVEPLGPGWLKYGYTPRLVPWLRERTGSLDAVIVNGVWQYHALAAWRALTAGPVPYYLYTHGMLAPWFARAHPLKHVKKCLYWWLVEHRVLRDAAAVLFTSEQERELASRSFVPYRVRARVVPFGARAPQGHAAAERTAFLARVPAVKDRRIVLFLGRVAAKKGADLLMRAFASQLARDPSLVLVMAGPDHGERAALEALSRALGIEHSVVWTGMLRGESKWGALRAAEVFVLPSHDENFCVAAVEALAVGVPVLISDRVGIWREVEAARAGLVAPDTLSGAESLLERWTLLSREERAAMGERGRALFTTRFEVGAAARALVDLIARD